MKIIQDLNQLSHLQNETIVVETGNTEMIVSIRDAVQGNNHLFCIKLHVNQNITSIAFKESWQGIPLVIYPAGLENVRDLIPMLPLLKQLNVKFFLNGSAQHYESVQILSSLGIYSGIVIDENADWERLTDLMYYALCGRVLHAPIEPFQYVYEQYEHRNLVDYGMVYNFTGRGAKEAQRAQGDNTVQPYQEFFLEATECGACEGWRICLGKYTKLKDKSKCKTFTTDWLQIIENLKFNH